MNANLRCMSALQLVVRALLLPGYQDKNLCFKSDGYKLIRIQLLSVLKRIAETMTDAKEVLALVKNLEKQRGDNAAVLEILKELEKTVVPTEKLLRETKVGVEVNKFKKSSDPEIAKIVKKMISSWKDAINKNKLKMRQLQQDQQKANTSTSPASDASVTPSTENKEGNTGPDAKRENKFRSSKPRNAKNDGVNTKVHHHNLRDSVIRAMYDALAKGSEHPPNSILQISVEIESEMNKLNNVAEKEKQYKEKYRIIYSNIISKNNPELRVKIANGDLTPSHLVNCDPSELAPEYLKKQMEEIKKQNLFNAQGATIERSVTDRFTCGKCKEKKVSYYQLQTRSADEPLTTFCTCEACGNRWKFS